MRLLSRTTLDHPQRLLLTGLSLIGWHLWLTWAVTHQTDQLVLNSLFWGAIASLLWQRRDRLPLQSNRPAQFLGLTLLIMTLVQSATLTSSDSWYVRLFPGFIALSWTLLASGLTWKPYRREWILVLTLMVPQGMVSTWLEKHVGLQLQLAIAQFATFILHYGGVAVTRNHTEIILSQAAVDVQYGCTGVPVFIVLLQLSILLLTLSPHAHNQWSILPVCAVLIAFIVSGIRVTIMAIVVNNTALFNYWHGSQGAQFFSILAILSLAWLQQHLDRRPGEAKQ